MLDGAGVDDDPLDDGPLDEDGSLLLLEELVDDGAGGVLLNVTPYVKIVSENNCNTGQRGDVRRRHKGIERMPQTP